MYSNENKKDGQIRIKFEKVQFVYIDINYLEYLHGIEPEIFFDKNEPNYKLKPHLGILLNNEGKEFVIPLTSGKDKHKEWADVTASWYRIYEVIDITKDQVKPDDVIVEIKNQNILSKIDKNKQSDYRQRILAVLDLRKMFPVDESVYKKIEINVSSDMPRSEM